MAVAKIEEFSNKKREPKPGVSDPPKIKPRCVIKPSELAGKTHPESIEDINKCIDELRQKMEASIKSGQHIQIG
ncbi:MAG: hypothetical protein R6U46_02865 [Marinilabilia sp.]